MPSLQYNPPLRIQHNHFRSALEDQRNEVQTLMGLERKYFIESGRAEEIQTPAQTP